MKDVLLKVLKVLGIVVLSLLVLCVVLVLLVQHDFSGADPVSVADCTNPHIVEGTQVSAHRSGGGIAPENTLMAFKNCVESGNFAISTFEFDLHITKDKELILLHDGTMDRTSDSAEVFGREDVKPSEMTYEELRRLNMGAKFVTDAGETPYKDLKGDQVPDDLRVLRLQDLFEYLAQYGEYDFIIEIKDGEDLGRQACDKLYDIMKEYDVLDRVIVGTFHGEISAYMDEVHPDMFRSAGMKEAAIFYLDSLLNLKRSNDYYHYVALQIPDTYELFKIGNMEIALKLGTTRMVNYAHKHNIAVQFWTINDEEKVRELASKGADTIMSDKPDMVYEVLKEMQ